MSQKLYFRHEDGSLRRAYGCENGTCTIPSDEQLSCGCQTETCGCEDDSENTERLVIIDGELVSVDMSNTEATLFNAAMAWSSQNPTVSANPVRPIQGDKPKPQAFDALEPEFWNNL